jgi:hypothetical protein
MTLQNCIIIQEDFMADKKITAVLDQRLTEEKIADPDYSKEYSKVHSFLNSHARRNGLILTEASFTDGDSALRDWLITLHRQGASQEKLTAYLRVGLAHLSLDFIQSQFSAIKADDLISRTLVSLKKRKFHKSFFRAPDEFRTDSSKKSAKKSSKKTNKKKAVASAKKSSSVKKRAAGKKTVKKSAKHNSSVKKTSSKKKAGSGKPGLLSRIFGKSK